MKKPLISVILPNYNHAVYLKERLDSILNQTYSNFELIILDDASNDESLSILEKYRNHIKVSTVVINQKNSGSPFKQWKKGLELARGAFIWIAESDDSCELNFLETQVEHLEKASISVARTFSFNNTGVQREIVHPVLKEKGNLILGNDQINFCPILNVSAILFKASEIKELLNSRFSEYNLIGDRVFYFEFFQHKKIAYNTETITFFRKEDAGLSNLKNKDLSYLKKYFKEHINFIRLAAKMEKGALNEKVNPYIHRFFNRVKNRVPGRKKRSFEFLELYLYYRRELLKTKFISLKER